MGYFNHAHFIRFLLWVDIATSYHLLMMCSKVMDIIRNPFVSTVTGSVPADDQDEPSLSELLFTVFNFAACVPVWLCVGMFSLYHLWLVSGNTTTIERWEKDKVSTMVRRGKIKEIKYPYVRLAQCVNQLTNVIEHWHAGQYESCAWFQPASMALAPTPEWHRSLVPSQRGR